MARRAAIVTGASRGIGLALAETLADEGYDLTVAARTPATIEQAAEHLRGSGVAVEFAAGNLADETLIKDIVARHRARYGRLDVLVNSAGVGFGAGAGEHQTKHIDLQLDLNVRSIVLFYRETVDLLRAAGGEHRSALVVNLASLAGKSPPAWLSVYGATKAAVVAYTQSMNKELAADGVRSSAFCPGFVDTDMTEFIRGQVPREEMIRTSDIAAALRFLLHLSPGCLVPEIVFARPDEQT
jgi:NAD(P)-dependent dehydrogenase (short-subunit alcohol dehydrogenase family)